MRESCCLNIEIGVEYLMFLLCFLNFCYKMHFGASLKFRKGCMILLQTLHINLSFFFNHGSKRKNRQVFQHSTPISTLNDLPKWHDACIKKYALPNQILHLRIFHDLMDLLQFEALCHKWKWFWFSVKYIIRSNLIYNFLLLVCGMTCLII